jgi:hypothetical protein
VDVRAGRRPRPRDRDRGDRRRPARARGVCRADRGDRRRCGLGTGGRGLPRARRIPRARRSPHETGAGARFGGASARTALRYPPPRPTRIDPPILQDRITP